MSFKNALIAVLTDYKFSPIGDTVFYRGNHRVAIHGDGDRIAVDADDYHVYAARTIGEVIVPNLWMNDADTMQALLRIGYNHQLVSEDGDEITKGYDGQWESKYFGVSARLAKFYVKRMRAEVDARFLAHYTMHMLADARCCTVDEMSKKLEDVPEDQLREHVRTHRHYPMAEDIFIAMVRK